jgi:hypothetical protein
MATTCLSSTEREAHSTLFESFARLNEPFSWARLGHRLTGSLAVHLFIVVCGCVLFYYSAPAVPDGRLIAIVPSYLMNYPIVGGDQGGGGGGGGKEEKEPPSKGDVPPAVETQFSPPEMNPPEVPKETARGCQGFNFQFPLQQTWSPQN